MKLEQHIIDDINQVQVWPPPAGVQIKNPTDMPLIGYGHQGAVFGIDDARCVKIYRNEDVAARELRALQMGQEAGICPEIYGWGDRWIAMEMIKTPSLETYVLSNPLTPELTQRLLRLIDTFKEIGYTRLDHAARHIYLMPDDKLKVIDVVHSVKPHGELKRLPTKLLKGLGQHAATFLRHVRSIRPNLYWRWVRHPNLPGTMAKAVGDAEYLRRPWWRWFL